MKMDVQRYAAAVHQRNMLHKKLYEARTPRIGVFFFSNGELFADPVPIRYGYYVQGRPDFAVVDGIVYVTRKHLQFENSITNALKQTKGMPTKTTALLRGRVVYDRKKRKYIVIAGKDILRDEKMKEELVTEFCLPDQRTRFVSMEGLNVKR